MEFSIFDVIYQFLMKVTRHVKSTHKGSLLNFRNILRKSIATPFVFCCDAKHSDTLLGSSHVYYYLFLQTFQLSRFCQNSLGSWYAVTVSRIESVCLGFYIFNPKIFIFL